MTTETWLGVIAGCQGLVVLVLLFVVVRMSGTMKSLEEQSSRLLTTAHQTVSNMASLLRDIRDRKVVAKAARALDSASGAAVSAKSGS